MMGKRTRRREWSKGTERPRGGDKGGKGGEDEEEEKRGVGEDKMREKEMMQGRRRRTR